MKKNITVIFKGRFRKAKKKRDILLRKNIDAFIENPEIDPLETNPGGSGTAHLYVYESQAKRAKKILEDTSRKLRFFPKLVIKSRDSSLDFLPALCSAYAFIVLVLTVILFTSSFSKGLFLIWILLLAFPIVFFSIWIPKNLVLYRVPTVEEEGLGECIQSHDAALVEVYLESGVEINKKIYYNKTVQEKITPLHLASLVPCKNKEEQADNKIITEMLIEAGASIDIFTLIRVIYFGKSELVKDFLENYTFPLPMEMTQSLLERLQSMNITILKMFNDTILPLHFACTSKGDPAVIPQLTAQGCDINAATMNGYTALHVAVSYNHKKIIQLITALLDHGAAVNAASTVGYTPLHLAILRQKQNREDVVKLLLERGADPLLTTGSNCGKYSDKTAFDLAETKELKKLF
ncbi:MAG: ankyrin repeat domain-containing protein [bacterium]|nr:ankyrin repeat domain-containing protein [bacterium]